MKTYKNSNFFNCKYCKKQKIYGIFCCLIYLHFCCRFLVSNEREGDSNFQSMFAGDEDIFAWIRNDYFLSINFQQVRSISGMLNRQISVTRATCATYILELKICNLPWHTLREKPTCDFIKQIYWRWNIQDIRHLRYIQEDANLTYSKTPFMRPQLGHKILVVNTRWSC